MFSLYCNLLFSSPWPDWNILKAEIQVNYPFFFDMFICMDIIAYLKPKHRIHICLQPKGNLTVFLVHLSPEVKQGIFYLCSQSFECWSILDLQPWDSQPVLTLHLLTNALPRKSPYGCLLWNPLLAYIFFSPKANLSPIRKNKQTNKKE